MVKESFLAQFYGKSQNYTDIPNKWYKEYNVKKGLRNEDGTGVRIGLTRVADVVGYEEVDGGIKAVWNFTPFRIRVPEDIVVQNTSLYAHLAVMFNRLNFNEIK